MQYEYLPKNDWQTNIYIAMQDLFNSIVNTMAKFNILANNTKRIYQAAQNQFYKVTGSNFIDLLSGSIQDVSRAIDEAVSKMEINDRTKRTYLSSLRSIAEDTMGETLPKSSIVSILNKKKLHKSEKADITREDVIQLIQYFETKKNKLDPPTVRNLILMKLIAGTAQRIGDILKISVSDAIRPILNFKQEKTNTLAVMDNPCLPEILAYKELIELKENDYLFATGYTRLPIDYTTAYRIIREAVKVVLQREDISPHTFRKYGAVRMAELGYSPIQIRTLTGHKTSDMIDYYVGQTKQIEDTRDKLI